MILVTDTVFNLFICSVLQIFFQGWFFFILLKYVLWSEWQIFVICSFYPTDSKWSIVIIDYWVEILTGNC